MSALLCTHFPSKPQLYPNNLISILSPFGTLIFLKSPVFTLTSKVFLSHDFSQKVHLLPEMPNFHHKSLQHTNFPQKSYFYPNCPFCKLIFLQSPKDLISNLTGLSPFGTLIFCNSPVSTLTAQFSPKCPFHTLSFA